MEYFDLNLRPIATNWDDKMHAISGLIVNAIRQYHNQEYATKLIVDYDERTSTLKIKDNGVGVNLSDFVQKANYNNTWLCFGLRAAISTLLGTQITINFKSNFGTFTPVIRNKDGLSQHIASIFLAYEPSVNKQDQWTNLKDIGNNQEDNSNHGTEVTICPLDANFVADLKDNFSFLLQWEKEIKTQSGILLVNKKDKINDLFVDGENITGYTFPNEDDDDKRRLTFSFDVNSHAFDSNLIGNRYNNPAHYAFDCICAIYDELNDKDKEFVFAKLLNNNDSVEWDNEMVRNLIVKYYAKTNPDQYLIGQTDSENDNYVEFAKQANKQIIWIDDQNEANHLADLGIKNVDVFGEEYVKKNYTDFVSVNKLNAHERTNWEALQSFLNYFIDANKPVQNALEKDDLKGYTIKIVENLPTEESIFVFRSWFGIINKKILGGSFADLLTNCKLIAFFTTRPEVNWDDFINMWYDSMANFIIAWNKDAPKEALN